MKNKRPKPKPPESIVINEAGSSIPIVLIIVFSLMFVGLIFTKFNKSKQVESNNTTADYDTIYFDNDIIILKNK